MSRFVTKIRGNYPLVFSVPHGGKLKPKDIPDRIDGVHGEDVNTNMVAKEFQKEFLLNGVEPYFVILELCRDKLDANRPRSKAYENEITKKIWEEYHGTLREYIDQCVKIHGKCFVIDLHGQSHKGDRIEIGYCVHKEDLASMNGQKISFKSSICHDGEYGAGSELILGENSIGEILTKAGYPAIPRDGVVPMLDEDYFSGGFTTGKYCFEENTLGFQIELNLKGIRDNAKNISKFSKVFAPNILRYLDVIDLETNPMISKFFVKQSEILFDQSG